MSSLIPGFEYDIFISYRQNDNKHAQDEKAKVLAQIKEMELRGQIYI